MRILGVDFGSRRIGLAVGESEHQIASPRSPLKPSGKLATDAAQLVKIAEAEGTQAIVLGVPYHEEDERMQRVCMKLKQELESLGCTVFTVDESLSSIAAHQNLRQHEFTAAERRRHVDGEAACVILERYFQEQG